MDRANRLKYLQFWMTLQGMKSQRTEPEDFESLYLNYLSGTSPYNLSGEMEKQNLDDFIQLKDALLGQNNTPEENQAIEAKINGAIDYFQSRVYKSMLASDYREFIFSRFYQTFMMNSANSDDISDTMTDNAELSLKSGKPNLSTDTINSGIRRRTISMPSRSRSIQAADGQASCDELATSYESSFYIRKSSLCLVDTR